MGSKQLILSTGSLYTHDTAFVFELAADAGFDGVEIMCDGRYSTRDPDYLCQLSAEHSLAVPVLHTPFGGHLPGWNATTETERVRHTLALADKIGAARVVVHLPYQVSRGTAQLGSRRFIFPWFSDVRDIKALIDADNLTSLEADYNAVIAVENMPAKQLFGKLRNLAWYNTIEQWSNVHHTLTLDTTHWGTLGINPIEPLRAAAGRVRHIHLSNYLRDGNHEHRLPQSGDLDLAAFLRELDAVAFDGTVSVELHPDALAFTTSSATRRKLRETVDFCRQHMG